MHRAWDCGPKEALPGRNFPPGKTLPADISSGLSKFLELSTKLITGGLWALHSALFVCLFVYLKYS